MFFQRLRKITIRGRRFLRLVTAFGSMAHALEKLNTGTLAECYAKRF